MRLVALGLGLIETGDGALALRLQRLDLALRQLEGRLRALKRGLLLVQLRGVLLGVLNGAIALFRQVLIARRLLLPEYQRRLRLVDLGLVGINLCLLDIDLRIDVLDAGLCGATCAWACSSDAVVAIVDAGDEGAGGHVLFVGDRHRRDVAGDLRRDGKLARRDEGIVGRLEMRGVVPVKIAACRRNEGDKQPDRDCNWMPPQQSPAGFFLPSFVIGHLGHAPLARRALRRRRRSRVDGILPGPSGHSAVANCCTTPRRAGRHSRCCAA